MIYKYTAICLMALVTLFVIHLLIIKLNNVEESAASQILSQSDLTPQGLYSASDKVVVLTANNFDTNVYNSTSAWLVQFYNSYCGHCIRFSSVWKQLAADIYNWRSVVSVGVINCASDENTQHCREYDIMGYPTIRLFKPYTVNFTIPEEYVAVSQSDASKLRNQVVTHLESVKMTSPPTTQWPHLRPIRKQDIDRVLLQEGQKSEFILIVEDANSVTGRNLIMDLNGIGWLAVRRILKEEYDRADSPYQIVSLAKNHTSTIVHSDEQTSRIEVFEKVRQFYTNKGYSIPDPFTKNAVNEVQRQVSVKQGAEQKKLVHLVFEADLETALVYSLAHEIPLKSLISGDSYLALVNYLRVIEKYFPFNSSHEASFVRSLLDQLAKSTSVTGKQFRELFEQRATEFLAKPKEWLGCKGSSQQFRGYTCGLWMVFHAMTVNRYVKDGPAAAGAQVLVAMTGYVKNFFGCRECAEHFLEMSTTIASNVSVASDEIMWLWRAHNNANRRLAGDDTEDPSFPKMQFPHKELCPACHNADDTWHEEQVLFFLVNMYTRVQYEKPAPANYLTNGRSSGWSFSLTDVNTCIALYVLSACLLTIYTVKLFLKRCPRPRTSRVGHDSNHSSTITNHFVKDVRSSEKGKKIIRISVL